MSKKLLSLVLAVAMVMSLFCVAFSSSAAADDTKAKETLTYYFLAPETYDEACCYWWEDGGCGEWPGVAMTAAPEIGKNVYKVDVSAYVGTIIFNNNNKGLQTENLGITEATTGKANVANMIFVITEGVDTNAAKGTWMSLDPNATDYYRTSAAYAVAGDTAATSYPVYDAAVVAGEEHKGASELTYYFFAPETYDEACCYWWEEGGCGEWPGPAMTAAPEIGARVYKMNVNVAVTTIIFNNNNKGLQTENLGISEATTGKSNVGNRIFVIKEGVDTNAAKGEWMSLDPAADDYYRKAAEYDVAAADETAVPAVPAYNAVPVCGEAPEETEDEPVIEGVSIYFRPDGEKLSADNTILFYVWDATTNKCATKSGWVDDNTWGSKRKTAGTTEEVDGEKLVKSYNIDIDSSHDVFVICYDMTTGNQTYDCVLTSAANGKVLTVTGNLLENPEDSEKTCLEAAFDGVEGCGPHKVVTSSCHVVGTAVTVNDKPVQQIADKVNKYLTDTENWTFDNVQAVIKAFDVTPDAVWAAYEATHGADDAAKAVILGDAKESDDNASDTDTKESDDNASDTDVKGSDTDTKESDDNASDTDVKGSDTDTKESDDNASDTDVKGSDTDTKESDDTATDTSDTDTKESDDTATDTSDTDTSDTDTSDTDTSDTDTSDTDTSDTDTSDTDNTDTDKPPVKDDAVKGDFDGDGEISSGDALEVLRLSISKDTFTEEELAMYDIDGDGEITSNDALQILRYSADLIDDNNKIVGQKLGAA